MSAVYVAFGILVALIQGGLPPVLRAKGLSVGQASLVFLLYLPFGLSFLWAPLIDRFQLPAMSRRVGWIVVMQAIAVVGLIVVAFSEHASIPFLMLAGFGISTAAATMDLALDAMTVEMAGERIRPVAAAFKLAGLSFGAIIGGGIILGVLQTIGWSTTFLLVSLVTIVATLPVFLVSENDRRREGERRPGRNAFASFFRRRHMTRRMLALLFISASMFPLTMLNRMMLLDLGMSLQQVGWIVGTLQPVFLLFASLLAGPLVARAGSFVILLAGTGAGFLAVMLLMFGFTYGSIPLAVTGAITISVVVGALFVVMGSHILSWAQGDQAATDYAIMFNGSRLAGAIAGMAAGGFVTLMGWQAFYAGGAVVLLLACSLLGFVIRDRPEQVHSVETTPREAVR